VGLNHEWFNDVAITLNESGIRSVVLPHPFLNLLSIQDCNLVLNLVALENTISAYDLIRLQNEFQQNGKQLVHLWEDVWMKREVQVLNRVSSLSGLNKRIHGRKTKVVSASKQDANLFFDKYHINGPVNAKYWFSLVYDFEIVAMASFSQVRPMKHKGEGYRSVELVRFASKPGYTVIGGLTKLIKYFSGIVGFDDLMSYADRDWSLGKGYGTSGFKLEGITEPSKIILDTKNLIRYFPHRLPIHLAYQDKPKLEHETFLKENSLIEIFNTGNLKYILYL